MAALVQLSSLALKTFDYANNTASSTASFFLSKVGLATTYALSKTTKETPPAILITGCSTGIGRHLALFFANQGYTVFATVRKRADYQSLAQTMVKGCLIPVFLDVTELKQIEHCFQFVKTWIDQHHTQLVALINNAGILTLSPVEITPDQDILKIFETNLFGPMTMIRYFLPLLKESKGRIVNMGSVASFTAMPGLGWYNATKAGLAMLTRALRMEMKPFGIAVCLIEPGLIRTPAYDKGLAALSSSLDSASAIDTTGHASLLKQDIPKAYVILKQSMMSMWRMATWIAHPTDHVVQAAHHAVTSSWPKETYLVGWDAYLFAWMERVVPISLQEQALATYFGLKKK